MRDLRKNAPPDALGGAFFRIFRKLSDSKKLNERIFSWIGTMIALWVYIKPKKFGFDIFYGFWENDQKLKIRNNAPLGHWAAGTGAKFRTYRIVLHTSEIGLKRSYYISKPFYKWL